MSVDYTVLIKAPGFRSDDVAQHLGGLGATSFWDNSSEYVPDRYRVDFEWARGGCLLNLTLMEDLDEDQYEYGYDFELILDVSLDFDDVSLRQNVMKLVQALAKDFKVGSTYNTSCIFYENSEARQPAFQHPDFEDDYYVANSYVLQEDGTVEFVKQHQTPKS